MYIYIYIHACIPTYPPTYIHIHIHTYVLVRLKIMTAARCRIVPAGTRQLFSQSRSRTDDPEPTPETMNPGKALTALNPE